jgi:intraflagellar transport protein 46
VLDEPAGKQSDPTGNIYPFFVCSFNPLLLTLVLDLHLRAVSKSIAPVPQMIRSLDSVSLRTNSKPLENWIRNVKELHTAKPPPSVHYSRRMPDIEELMQVWPPEMEAALDTVSSFILSIIFYLFVCLLACFAQPRIRNAPQCVLKTYFRHT